MLTSRSHTQELMEYPRHIVPSNYPSHQLPSDSVHLSRSRQPLSDSAGNAQYHNLATIGTYHDLKGLQPRIDHNRPRYSLPTVPSQPARPVASALELRRNHTRRQRLNRHRSRNPLVDSPQYQAYRQRQCRDGNDDQKWPAELEEAFLDAIVDIPQMGRRKYSFKGKPHGRNELIKVYLWIAYCQSLPPGAVPDPTMERTRKQVSSHIQVLKGFMRGHPAFDRLFPSKDKPHNGFEDSFKNDPCLLALQAGRLPNKRQHYDFEDYGPPLEARRPLIVRPYSFEMKITDGPENYIALGKEKRTIWQYSKMTPYNSEVERAPINSIPHWRSRFPRLSELHSRGELSDCTIIHLDSSLEIWKEHAPKGAELCTKLNIMLPGSDLVNAMWRTSSSMYKPQELYSNDAPLDGAFGEAESPQYIKDGASVVTKVSIGFPANPWAHAFTSLANMYTESMDDQKRRQHSLPSARDYINQISQYQEVQSQSDPSSPWIRRAILIWTFRKAPAGDRGETTWRFMDMHQPPREIIFSPRVQKQCAVSAAMNENFSSWAESQPGSMQPPNLMDPFGHGYATPPLTAALQSPFESYGYSQAPPHDTLSFMSEPTHDSEPTLVSHEPTSQQDSQQQIDNFNIHSGDFSGLSQGEGLWSAPPIETFDGEGSWSNYTTVPPQGQWDSGLDIPYDSNLNVRIGTK